MLTLYGLNTPNSYKVTIGLEEMGLAYAVRPVDVRAGAQFDPDIVALNPNAKIPILTDDETGTTLAEANAILLYLAEKTGTLFPTSGGERAKGLELLFFQAASIGPLFGQRAHFAFHAGDGDNAHALVRYDREGDRLYGVLDDYMSRSGDWFLTDFSIVDIAIYGWMHTAVHMGFGTAEHPHLDAWCARMQERPAVIKGVSTPDILPPFPDPRRP